MQLTLDDEWLRFIDDRVRSGRNADANEVVTLALLALREAESDQTDAAEAVRAKIARGLDQIRQGRTVSLDQARQDIADRSRVYRAANP